jgi:hypothetical protein
MNNFFYLLGFIFLILSCGKVSEPRVCEYDNISGEYMFYSDKDTSTSTIQITVEGNEFKTTGINGYGFWFPAAPFSGKLDGCNVIIDSYKNSKRQGLSSPGGIPRYYYENMDGQGELFPEKGCITIFLNYKRTENWEVDFSGNIYFKKL